MFPFAKRIVRAIERSRGLLTVVIGGAGVAISLALLPLGFFLGEVVADFADQYVLLLFSGSFLFFCGAALGRFESDVFRGMRRRLLSSVDVTVHARTGGSSQETFAHCDLLITAKRDMKNVTTITLKMSKYAGDPTPIEHIITPPSRTLNVGEQHRVHLFDSYRRDNRDVAFLHPFGSDEFQEHHSSSFVIFDTTVYYAGGPDVIRLLYWMHPCHPCGKIYTISENISTNPGDGFISSSAWEYEFGDKDSLIPSL
ncbi:hypothetical protein GOC54_33780 [Sinorhizobium meliloti]|nr:hypothetical protein [Sinorhizobium meliloti]